MLATTNENKVTKTLPNGQYPSKKSEQPKQAEIKERIPKPNAGDYCIIADKLYKTIHTPDKKMGTSKKGLAKWNKTRLRDDVKIYKKEVKDKKGKEKVKFEPLWLNIPRYDIVAVYPDYRNYQKRIVVKGTGTVAYNLCNPLPHDWENAKGDFPTIKKFMEHIFSNSKSDWQNQQVGNPLTMALDCYRLKLQNPTQLLPVLCLVSSEEETGKTTLLKFNEDLAGSNAVVIGKRQLDDPFNTTYADKQFIGVDENFISIKNPKAKERLKQMVTNDTIFFHAKGIDATPIPFYPWLCFTSNKENDFMQMRQQESRFWVVKVKPIPKEQQDSKLRDKMLLEMPAFINYCMNTAVVHPDKSRFWFAKDLIITKQMQKIIHNTREPLQVAIEDTIKEVFTTYGYNEWKIALIPLTRLINEGVKYRFDKNEIKRWLKINKGVSLSKNNHKWECPMGFIDPEKDILEGNLKLEKGRGKVYIFSDADWFTVKEQQEEIDRMIAEMVA